MGSLVIITGQVQALSSGRKADGNLDKFKWVSLCANKYLKTNKGDDKLGYDFKLQDSFINVLDLRGARWSFSLVLQMHK